MKIKQGSMTRLLVSCGLAMAALALYGSKKVDPEKFAVDATMALGREHWNGVPFTASNVRDISAVVAQERGQTHATASNVREIAAVVAQERRQTHASGRTACAHHALLWLGNSQLHFINQFQRGDRLAPYWLRRSLRCAGSVVPLGFSLPNASIQEHYIIARYAAERLPIQTVLLSLVFDDLREDGLRGDFRDLLTSEFRATLKAPSVAAEIVGRADTLHAVEPAEAQNVGLEGFAQKRLEDGLNDRLSAIWPLWADRGNLRARLLTDLYGIRNTVLGIKATTIRKMIPDRYDRNMRALEEMLGYLRQRGIRVIAYIAPIRQDQPLPYDAREYARWKSEVAALAPRYGADLVNLEALVPGDLWGEYNKGQVDFMHFRGPGHRLLGEALLPYVGLPQTSAHAGR
jgi:hypothetical protein